MNTYEKKHKEEVVRATQLWECGDITRENLEYIFPELAESEDEKIRNALLEMVHDTTGDELWIDYNVHKEEALAWLEKQGKQASAIRWYDTSLTPEEMRELLVEWDSEDATWHEVAFYHADTKTFWDGERQVENVTRWCYIDDMLEKQGEQKPAIDFRAEDWCVSKVDGKIHNIYNSEVGPKFHRGEWIVHQGTEKIYQVIGIVGNQYQLKYGDNYTIQKCADVDRCTRLWDIIKDAKDGDVLVCGSGWTCIFKKLNHNSFGEIIFDSYCFIDRTGCFCNGAKGHTLNERINGKIYPAPKEQRELLFKKMKEAGYEWDANKKELKKFHVIDEGKAEMDYCFTKMLNGEKVSSAWSEEEYNGEDYGIDSLYHAQRILEKTLGKVDGYRTDDGILSHKCAITAVKKLYGQKPSWSEEDESILQGIWDEILANKHDAKEYEWKTYDKFLDWLKSIKQRLEQ